MFALCQLIFLSSTLSNKVKGIPRSTGQGMPSKGHIFLKQQKPFVNRKVKNDLWIQMIKKYFQEITGHSYFLHHHGQIKKQTTYLIVVVLQLACASESLGNLNKSQIASPIPFLIHEVQVHKNFHFWQVPRQWQWCC